MTTDSDIFMLEIFELVLAEWSFWACGVLGYFLELLRALFELARFY